MRGYGSPTSNHALLPSSPAINHIPVENCRVINNQRDIARLHGTGCDTGAFEVRSPGDAHGDDAVNVADLRIVAAALGTSHRADLNWDGVVDIWDIALVGINLGRIVP